LQELKSRERFDLMVTKLQEALKVVEAHRDAIQDAVDEEHLRYVASVAEDTLEDTRLMAAILGKVAQSDEAMSKLAQSDEAMSKLAQSEEALATLMKTAKKDPQMRAKLLALLSEPEAGDPSP
jgi:alpha-ketoglutarate-dependent taurine dioxygenase